MAAWDADPIVAKAGPWDADPIVSAGAAQATPNNDVNATNVARSFSRGVPVIGGLLDEANAATNAALDPAAHAIFGTPQIPGASFGERYTNELANQRGMDRGFDAAHPFISTGAQLAGGLASGGALAKAAPKVAGAIFSPGTGPLLEQAVTGAAKGATLGGVDAFTRGEGGFDARVDNAKTGAEVGGALGAVAPVVSSVAGRAFGTKPSTPTGDDLRTQADALYDAADTSGVVVKGTSFNKMANDLNTKMTEDDILDPILHPKANRAMERLLGATNVAGAPNTSADLPIRRVETLRRIIGVAAKSNEPDERRIASAMQDHLDNYLGDLTPNDVVGGNTQNVGQLLSGARDVWGKMRKGEVVDDLVDRAKLKTAQGGDPAQAIAAEFKTLALNKAQFRRFAPDEQAAIRSVAEGGLTSKTLGQISKVGRGLFGNLLALGGLATGHAEAMAPKVIGETAGGLRNVLVENQAKNVAAGMRNGAPVPARQFSPQQHEAFIRRLASAIPTLNGAFGR